MAEVAGFRNIHSLNLMRSTLSDAGLMKLASMKQLLNLKLDRCSNVTPEAIEALKKKMKNCVFQVRTQADINSTT